jgi:hypothetical protein
MSGVVAVMLLGGLRRSALEAASGVVPATLPLDARTSLLSAWAAAIRAAGCRQLRVVVSGDTPDRPIGAVIDAALARLTADETDAREPFEVTRVVEPASHRGTGGLLRDVTTDLTPEDLVLLVEPHCLPPVSLAPLVVALDTPPGEGRPGAAVGVARRDELAVTAATPAGVSMIRREFLDLAPRIGYHDFKEQFLPLLVGRGIAIRPVPLEASGLRVHDLAAYRAAVADWRSRGLGPNRGPSVGEGAAVAASARLIGDTILMAGAKVGEDAVVQDSVVLENAVVGDGAVVARSLIPPGFRVAPRSLVVDRVLDAESSSGADELIALGTRGRTPGRSR